MSWFVGGVTERAILWENSRRAQLLANQSHIGRLLILTYSRRASCQLMSLLAFESSGLLPTRQLVLNPNKAEIEAFKSSTAAVQGVLQIGRRSSRLVNVETFGHCGRNLRMS